MHSTVFASDAMVCWVAVPAWTTSTTLSKWSAIEWREMPEKRRTMLRKPIFVRTDSCTAALCSTEWNGLLCLARFCKCAVLEHCFTTKQFHSMQSVKCCWSALFCCMSIEKQQQSCCYETWTYPFPLNIVNFSPSRSPAKISHSKHIHCQRIGKLKAFTQNFHEN